jgi:hypothetical protein
MLGTIAENAPAGNLQGKDKEAFLARRKETAVHYYSTLVVNYPLSPLLPKVKDRLTSLGAPIPQPDAAALERMQKEQDVARNHPSPMRHVTGVIHSGPDVSMAARVGTPNLNPPDNNGGGGETLNAALTNLNVTGAAATPGANAGGRVEGGEGSAVLPGGGSSVQPPVQPGKVGTTNANPGESSSANPPSPAGAAQPGASAGGTTAGTTSATTSGTSSTANPPANAQAKPCGPDAKDNKQGSSSSGSSSSSDSKTNDKNKKKPDCDPNKGNESSSKKKSGIHRIIPW